MDVKLIMFTEDGTRREFTLREGVNTIGRKQDCDIRIPLSDVSRRHTEILIQDDEVVIKDLGAANGTYLNNRRVEEEDLEPGDQIIIGPVVFTVQIDGDPEDDEIMAIPTKLRSRQTAGQTSGVATSPHVNADDDDDPISALEALASSADEIAIDPDDDDDLP